MAIYMMRDDGRQPTGTTLVYLPLDWDATDKSWNGHNWTLTTNNGGYSWEYISGNSWTKCFRSYIGSISWVNKNGGKISWDYSSTALWTSDRTVSIWVKFIWPTNNGSPHWIGSWNWWTNGEWFGIYFWSGKFWILRYYDDPNMTKPDFWTTWHNIIVTYSTTNLWRMYIDWVKQTLTSNATQTFNTLSVGYQLWVLRTENTSQTTEYYMSEFIVDGKEWTAQEVLDYYNDTKSNYWL